MATAMFTAQAAFALASKAISGSIRLVKESITLSAEQARQEKLLAAAFKTAGTFTQEAFESATRYAGVLQQLTTFGDEEIISAQRL